MRTILLLAGLLTVGAVPVTGAAQHGATPAPPAHAATAVKPAVKPAAQPEKAPASTHGTGATHGTSPTPSAKTAAAPAEPAAGAKHDTKAVAESKPSAKADKPGTHEAKVSDKTPAKAAVTARKGAPFSELEAAFDRIAQKIDGAEVMPGGLRISSGSPAAPAPAPSPAPARAAEGRPAEARAARSEATPRLQLTWRSSVVWPATLGPADAHDTDPAHKTSRIALAWP